LHAPEDRRILLSCHEKIGKRVTLRCLALFGLLCLGAAPVPPTPWPLGQYVRWDPAWGARDIEVDGLRVRVEPRRCGEDRPESEACFRGDPYVEATVSAPGEPAVVLHGDAGVAAYVGIGKLASADGAASAILISEGGGSAGCVAIDIATVEQNGLRAVRLRPDPEESSICWVDPEHLAWPRDLTGHGRAEFLFADTRFSCLFTSCAGTWYPPRVVAFEGGRGVDVSDDPALLPLYRADMAKARAACEGRTVEAQGACAGYAADALRLGRLEEAWGVIAAQVKRGCRVPAPEGCGDSERIPLDFPARLAAVLGK
jgi:hypothetical protein